MNKHLTEPSCDTSIPEGSSMNRSRLKAIVVFILDGQPFGIDISLVHSFTPAGSHIPVTDIHPSLIGFFRLTTTPGSGSAIPLLNIAHLLGKNEPQSAEKVIISELHQSLLAFSVNKLAGIYDLSQYNLLTIPQSIPGLLSGAEVLLPDFHSLTYGVIEALRQKQMNDRQQKQLLLVHNSAPLREILTVTFRASGYTNLTELDDYDKAYPYVLEKYTAGCLPDLLIMGSTGQPPLCDLQSLIGTIRAGLRFRILPSMLLTDRYDLPLHPAINAQVNPFNLAGLIEQSDVLTGNVSIPPLNALLNKMRRP